jgi:hypothetical protein
MTRAVQAKFDGEAFYPEEPMPIAPNTRVLLMVVSPEETNVEEPPPSGEAAPVLGEPYSFLKLAMSLNLDLPES